MESIRSGCEIEAEASSVRFRSVRCQAEKDDVLK